MNSKRSRLAVVGVLALALTVVVGLASGSVAEAKKKKGGNVVTVTHGPQALLQATGNPANSVDGVTPIQFTVGKKAKGKVVAADSVVFTYTLGGAPGYGNDYSLRLINPKGRTIDLPSPGGPNSTTIGPLTISPNSPGFTCNPAQPGDCQPGATAFAPQFAGTIGDEDLALFTGTGAKGVWTAEFRRSDPTKPPAQLNSATLQIGLTAAGGV